MDANSICKDFTIERLTFFLMIMVASLSIVISNQFLQVKVEVVFHWPDVQILAPERRDFALFDCDIPNFLLLLHQHGAGAATAGSTVTSRLPSAFNFSACSTPLKAECPTCWNSWKCPRTTVKNMKITIRTGSNTWGPKLWSPWLSMPSCLPWCGCSAGSWSAGKPIGLPSSSCNWTWI